MKEKYTKAIKKIITPREEKKINKLY